MIVWVIEESEDHAPGYLMGVTSTAAGAVAFLRGRFGEEASDPKWGERTYGKWAHHVTPVDEMPATVDGFSVTLGEGWRMRIWDVTRFEVDVFDA